jgi:hypothetical protein
LNSRFSRSTRCAFVSWTKFDIKEKTHRQLSSGDGWMIAGITKLLSQQPARASAHECATTTSATAQPAKISAT